MNFSPLISVIKVITQLPVAASNFVRRRLINATYAEKINRVDRYSIQSCSAFVIRQRLSEVGGHRKVLTGNEQGTKEILKLDSMFLEQSRANKQTLTFKDTDGL